MNALAYGRRSTDTQDNTLPMQESLLRAYASTHQMDLADDALYLEDAVSGSIPFALRPRARQLMSRLRTGRYTDVLVHKIDRLGRNALDVLNTLEEMKKLGVRVHVLDLGGQSFDTTSAIGGMIVAVLAFAAQMEVERIRERTQTALADKSRKGELIGTVPYGWDAVETGQVNARGLPVRRLVVNEAEARWVRQMAAWRRAGLAYNQIARRLNARGVPTKNAGRTFRRNGQPRVAQAGWQCGNVARVLQNAHPKRLLRLPAQADAS